MMPKSKIKLTAKMVERLHAPDPRGKQTLYWDAELKGFGLLVSGVSTAKTFIVQSDLRGRSRRVTIGPANVIDADEARKIAKDKLADFYRGIDPKVPVSARMTLQQALDGYLAARKDLRPASVRMYRHHAEHQLGSWLATPLRDISADMVEKRHAAIAADINKSGRHSGEATANFAMMTLRVLWNYAADRAPASSPMPPMPTRRLRKQWFRIERRTRIVRAADLPKFYNAIRELPNPIARD
jgi:hypothetical protein